MPQCSTEDSLDKRSKKKRWWGDLFRRSNKSRRKQSDSSSDEDNKRGFLGRKRHSDRGSKDVTNSFLINPGLRDIPRGRSLDSVKSPEKNNKRKVIKAKVEASRELLRDSSSDEASSSYTTGSLHSGGSFPRRSRAARTERHIRRLSRDIEIQNSNINKSKWSANVIYQECKEYDRKYRAKARSATPSPAQSPKIKRSTGRATSFDNIKSSPPPPPPRKLPEQRPLSLDTPMKVYNPPIYTAPIQSKLKSRFQNDYINEPWLLKQKSLEDFKKPPTVPIRRQILNIEEHRRQQNNLEEALNELEAIYKKLASDDSKENSSEMLDDKRPLEDDMAYRRLNKREPSSQNIRDVISQSGSYLLVSPTLSPPPITPHSPITNGDEPDIINDDVVYRTIQHSNNTLKISDPQPLFGIPIGPISPSRPSDYLHIDPSFSSHKFNYRSSKTPDIIRDDLAFRNLRKDTKEVKKKKAVRSLSANLSNIIINNNNSYIYNNNLENRSYSFQDIPEELRMAHYLKKNRPKEEDEQEKLKKYQTELYESENDLLRELEEEARATSVQLDKELQQLTEQQLTEPSVEALYSRSMTDLLKELTKNLDYDFGFKDENQQEILNCQTCDLNNKRKDIAESRRKFFESKEFNKKIYDKDNRFLKHNPESIYNEKYINTNEFKKNTISNGTFEKEKIKKGNIYDFKCGKPDFINKYHKNYDIDDLLLRKSPEVILFKKEADDDCIDGNETGSLAPSTSLIEVKEQKGLEKRQLSCENDKYVDIVDNDNNLSISRENTPDKEENDMISVAGSSRNGCVELTRGDVEPLIDLEEDDVKQGSLVWAAYWIACSQQLIGLDLITIFAIILAVMSIVLFIVI